MEHSQLADEFYRCYLHREVWTQWLVIYRQQFLVRFYELGDEQTTRHWYPASLTYVSLGISELMVRWITEYNSWLPKQEIWCPGGRLNKKDGLTRYGDSHVKDKTS